MLGLKGEYWGLLPNSVLSSHQPIPKAQRELFSKQSLWPLLTALRPIPGSHRDLPPCPLPPDFPPPRKAPWRTGGSLLARCPLTLPCPHNGDARNAHLWVGSANTPSLNTTHAQSGTPIPHSLRFLPVSLPPSSPPPHNGPLSSGHSTLACPLAPPPPRPRQQLEVKVLRRSWCPSLFPGQFSPLLAPPGPPSSARFLVASALQRRVPGRSGLGGSAGENPLHQTLQACTLGTLAPGETAS